MKTQSNHTTLSGRFEALRPRLRVWASRLLGSKEDADDALQEAFFRLWRQKDRVEKDLTSVDTISMTALRSACIDSLRRRSIRRADPIEASETIADSPAEAMADMAEDVRRLIETRLDSRAREILLLHDSLGYTYTEISERMGISEPNARVILSRARKTIRDAYRQQL